MSTVKYQSKRRIGLLGGSFNPPHAGHIYISKLALKRMLLDEIWWMISPGNPLKKLKPTSFRHRKEIAESLIQDSRIVISDFEFKTNTHITSATITKLKQAYPRLDFFWLMGADNLIEFHKWEQWQTIFDAVPIVVFSRDYYDLKGITSKASRIYAPAFRPIWRFPKKYYPTPPLWTFVKSSTLRISSTQIREEQQNDPIRT